MKVTDNYLLMVRQRENRAYQQNGTSALDLGPQCESEMKKESEFL